MELKSQSSFGSEYPVQQCVGSSQPGAYRAFTRHEHSATLPPSEGTGPLSPSCASPAPFPGPSQTNNGELRDRPSSGAAHAVPWSPPPARQVALR
jgi:hypothetical protein